MGRLLPLVSGCLCKLRLFRHRGLERARVNREVRGLLRLDALTYGYLQQSVSIDVRLEDGRVFTGVSRWRKEKEQREEYPDASGYIIHKRRRGVVNMLMKVESATVEATRSLFRLYLWLTTKFMTAAGMPEDNSITFWLSPSMPNMETTTQAMAKPPNILITDPAKDIHG